MAKPRGKLWAIVLAAGRGKRLAALTAAIHGREMPKQFAALLGSRTFVQVTLDRAAKLAPPERTVVVVAADQRELAARQLARYAGVEIICQPADRGTGPGLLLPLMHVLHRDPHARVVVLPCDHHFAREAALVDGVRRAVTAAERSRAGVALVGVAAEHAATDLGWIACGPRCGPTRLRARRVERFVEKPSAAVASTLLQAGALWNTLVVAARGTALWRLARERLPVVTAAVTPYRAAVGGARAAELLSTIYLDLPSADLSHDMLEGAKGLAAVALVDAGWSDCGTPERLFRALAGTSALRRLRERLRVTRHAEGQREGARLQAIRC